MLDLELLDSDLLILLLWMSKTKDFRFVAISNKYADKFGKDVRKFIEIDDFVDLV